MLIVLLIGVVWNLSVIPEGAADVERAAYASTSTLDGIVDNPLSLPYKLVAYVAHYTSDSIRVLRAISLVVFGLTVIALYRILKIWHSDKIALFAASMYATNALALTVARLGTPLVLLFGWSLLISAMMWIQHGRSRKVAPAVFVVSTALLLYVPGAPYFFVLLAIIFNKKIRRIMNIMPRKSLALIALCFFSLLSLLMWALVQDVTVLKQWLLLPETINWAETARNILRVPSAYIYRSPIDPLLGVGRLPIFDVAVGGLFLVGLYVYQKKNKLERTKVMLLTALLAIVIGALGQVTAAVVLLLPFVYAVVAAGMSYLLDEWYKIFPRNPFARSFGLLLVTFVVLMTMYYQMTRFLVVWPQAPETRNQYNQSRLVQ